MSRRTRILVLLPALAVLAAALLVGYAGIPDFGHYRGPYGDVLNRITVPERHITNAVAGAVFDYRGFDTMGEEFILFTSVVGVVLLLREQTTRADEERREPEESARPPRAALLLFAPAVTIGLWLAAFGYITPGGGFQAGVVLAGAVLLLALVWRYDAWHRATPEIVVDPVEAVGAGGYVVIGLVGLASTSAFLANLLGSGKTGTLLSGGSVGFLNGATALEVTAANVLLFREFLEALLTPERG